jgi:tetratricopeptide (TPR) repeat protein
MDPKHENAIYNKGVILYQLGNYTEAIGYFDKALAIDPKDEDALYEKGLDNLENYTGVITILCNLVYNQLIIFREAFQGMC